MAAQKKAVMVEAVVASGHTVSEAGKNYGPGQTVTVEEGEAERLLALGFLVKPDAPVIPTGDGPTFTPSGGPSVSVVEAPAAPAAPEAAVPQAPAAAAEPVQDGGAGAPAPQTDLALGK